MREQLKAVMKAKTVSEALKLLPWSFVEAFAALPAIMFIFSVIVDVIMMFVIAYPYLFLLDDMWISFYILGAAAVLLYLGKCIVEKVKFRDIVKQNTPMIFFMAMAIFILISTMINGWTEYAVNGHDIRRESVFVYLSYIIVFFFCSSLVKSEKIKKIIIYSFVAVSLIFGICVAATLILDTKTFILYISHSVEWIIGIYTNPNHYAYYLNVAVICSGALFALEKDIKIRIFSLITFLLNTVILFLNDTMGCYIASLGGLIFLLVVMFIIDKRINLPALFLILMFVAIALGINFYTDSVASSISNMATDIHNIAENNDAPMDSTRVRWTLWKESVQCISERPFFGFGTDGIEDRLRDLTGEERSHNEYLQYTAFYGIPAALCYLAGVMAVFIHGLKNKAKLDKYAIISLTAAFAYCFSAFFGVSRTYTAPYLFIFLGLGFGICRNREK